MKHSLQLKLSQHLALTPQLQQSIRLLQLSTLELNQELDVLLQENPLLERLEQNTSEEYADNYPASESSDRPENPPESHASTDETPAGSDNETDGALENLWEGAGSYSERDDEEDYEPSQTGVQTISLREHLSRQLGFMPLSERDKSIVSLLIDALNEDGYLTQDIEELASLLPAELEIEPIELQAGLKHLQHFDPPGVGATTLSECLTLQLDCLSESTPYRDIALHIVQHHLEVLGAKDFNKLKRLLQCDESSLRSAQKLITQLNPKPGADFAPADTRYIVHDIVVKKVKGLWIASLNPDAVPKLRINRMYAEILQRNRTSSSQQLNSQLQEAKWLIKNIQLRFNTILKVAQAIVDRQRLFFSHGDVAMRPLVLREIAEAVNLHESTISRVTTQKYMLTPRGIFELKHFFGSHVATETGGACSATAIRALIKQLVGSENTRKPYSDSQITQILSKQGIHVARRTIAKYREALQIPPVNLRKSI